MDGKGMVCVGCGKHPDQIEEYVEAAKEWEMSPADYVRWQEGTLNKTNGHFACTACYINMGSPSAPYSGWKAP